MAITRRALKALLLIPCDNASERRRLRWRRLGVYLAIAGLAVASSCITRMRSQLWANPEDGKLLFAGYRALVVLPDTPGNAYDSAIYGALSQQGMEVVWGEPAILEDTQKLEQFDLVATNTQRRFTNAQMAGLTVYLEGGGALYGSWGGPSECPGLLRLCGASAARTVFIKAMILPDGPLTQFIGECHLQFPTFAGDQSLEDPRAERRGRGMFAFDFVDGIKVAKDADGQCLGILKKHDQGRTAVLGFGPEQYKYCFEDRQLANQVFVNLLRWLMPQGPKPHPWSNVVEVSLPRRADVLSVSLNDTPVESPETKLIGSLKKILLPVARIKTGETATIRVAYKPLVKARNVETWLHHPCGEFGRAFETPAKAAAFAASLNTTVAYPLLRYSNGVALYRCLPDDTPDDVIVNKYNGDFLAEYIAECHKLGIKVVGGMYLTWEKMLLQHPEIGLIEKNGVPSRGNLACPNNPDVQEHNLSAVRHLVKNYPLDGLMLEDNFRLDTHPCYCAYCKEQFKSYCAQKGHSYRDPSTLANTDDRYGTFWRGYWQEATRTFCGKVRKACGERGVPVGGWVGAGMESVQQANTFDFLGGMMFATPASAIRGPLSVLGNCGYVTLLWAMNRQPADMEAEAAEAVRSGSQAVGFWVMFREKGGGKDNRGFTTGKNPYGFTMEPGCLDAIAHSLGSVEEEWLAYYRGNILGGDARFVILSAKLGREELTLVVKNLGQRTDQRAVGAIDLSAIK